MLQKFLRIWIIDFQNSKSIARIPPRLQINFLAFRNMIFPRWQMYMNWIFHRKPFYVSFFLRYAQFAGYDFKNKATATRFVACREATRIALGSGFFQSNPHANAQNNGLMKFAILPTIGVCAGAGTMLLYSQDYSDRQTRLEKQH